MVNQNQPEFPVTVWFHEDNDRWILDSIDELGSSLEWFNSDDPTENATVTDRNGRVVRVVVEKLEVKVFELQ